MSAPREDFLLGVFTIHGHEPVSRIIPSPFQLAKKPGDYAEAERCVQQHLQNIRKRSRASTVATASSEVDLRHGLHFGKLLAQPSEFNVAELRGWSSKQIERSVPFGRVLRVLDRVLDRAPRRPLAPRGTSANRFTNATLLSSNVTHVSICMLVCVVLVTFRLRLIFCVRLEQCRQRLLRQFNTASFVSLRAVACVARADKGLVAAHSLYCACSSR